ncbi:MAG: hypothetical protein Q9221_008194 [Calogaya cf. arnoldii]
MSPLPQSLTHPLKLAFSAPNSTDDPDPSDNPSQLLMIYALITTGIFAALIIFEFLALAFCNLHYSMRMNGDRDRAAELESGCSGNDRAYGTIGDCGSLEEETETDTIAELKDGRDTDTPQIHPSHPAPSASEYPVFINSLSSSRSRFIATNLADDHDAECYEGV